MTNRLVAGSPRETHPPEYDGIASLAMHRNNVSGWGFKPESQRLEIIYVTLLEHFNYYSFYLLYALEICTVSKALKL